MAQMTLKEFRDKLHCSVCLDTFTDPKLLQCFHVYCQKCLVKLVVRDQQGQLIVSCPICHHATPVPENGMAGLQPAFQINYFHEIVEKHKKAVEDPSSVEISTPQHHIRCHCTKHGGKEVELYCETCTKLICKSCVVKGSKHHSHEYEELDKAFERYKAEITTLLEPMEEQLTTVNQAMTQSDSCCGEVSNLEATIEADLQHHFTKIQEILETRKTELVGQLHQIAQSKLRNLVDQRDQLETTKARISSCLGFMRDSLTIGSQAEVLMMKSAVIKQVKELTTAFPPEMLKPNTEADMIFSVTEDITEVCHTYGQVSAPDLPDPSQCLATGKGTEEAAVGELSTVTLHAVNFTGQPCEGPVSTEIELVSELTGTRTQGSIERSGQNQYEISYHPVVKGRHQLHIKVEGQHVSGSPFTITAKSSVERLGTPILTLSETSEPCDVTINQSGEVIVSDYGADYITVFSPAGEKLRSFGTRGSGQRRLKCLNGVTVDADGNILVADSDSHCIQKFTAEGQFLAAIRSDSSGTLPLNQPEGIVFNPINNKLYVTDYNHCVHVFNSDLTFSKNYGKHGSSKGQFDHPRGIACDSTGKVYVVDCDNHRVQVFTAEGKPLTMFGRRGMGRGELLFPIGVAVGPDNMVYVSEGGNHRVSVFTPEGVFVTLFGSYGSHSGQFHRPHGIAVDNSGVVYVCDWINNRVQIF